MENTDPDGKADQNQPDTSETREAKTIVGDISQCVTYKLDDEFRPGAITTAIKSVMADLKPVGKNQQNFEQKFKFRGIDDMYNALQPVMAKHGVFCVPKILNREIREVTSRNNTAGFHRVIQYRIRFYASDGSWVDAFVDGEGTDYGDKGSNKCLSIAMKYAMITVFAVPTGESADPDGETPPEAQNYGPRQSSGGRRTNGPRTITDKQVKRWYAIFRGEFTDDNPFGWTADQVKEIIKTSLGKGLDDLVKQEYDAYEAKFKKVSYQQATEAIAANQAPPAPQQEGTQNGGQPNFEDFHNNAGQGEPGPDR